MSAATGPAGSLATSTATSVPRRARGVLAVSAAGVFVVFLDATVVNIASPALSADFRHEPGRPVVGAQRLRLRRRLRRPARPGLARPAPAGVPGLPACRRGRALEHGILTQAWSPIGGITFYRDAEHTSALEDPTLTSIAGAHGKSRAQVMLRWGLQQGRSVIPTSTKPHRIVENIDVFDFDLTADELTAIDSLETGTRGGPAPEDVTLESFGRDIAED